MKTTLLLKKQSGLLKWRMKVTLLIMSIFVISFMKGQPPANSIRFISPANSYTINNRCDLKLCIKDSLGWSGISNKIWVSSTANSPNNVYNADFVNDVISNMGDTTCIYPRPFYLQSLTGVHKLYLGYSTFGVVDSIELFFNQTIWPITCPNYTVSNGTGGNSILTLIGTASPGLSGQFVKIRASGSSTPYYSSITVLSPGVTFTTNIPASTGTSSLTICSSAFGSCINPSNDSCVINTTYTMCDSSVITQSLPSIPTAPICISDTIYCFVNAVYLVHGIQNNSKTVSCTINWGDGSSITAPLFLTTTYERLFKHTYSAPGVYSYKIKYLSDASCNDSIVGSITVKTCGNLTGTVYNDANNDCNQNPGELGIANIPVKASMGTNVYVAWTDASGHYAFGNIPTGNYLIQINGMSVGYTITCGNSLPHITNVSTPGTTVENFALHCNGFDIAVNNIQLWNGFFPGQYDGIFPEVFMLNNACNVTVPGQVKVVLTPCITYTPLAYSSYGNPTPFPTPSAIIPAITGDTIVWNVSDINDLDYLSYTNAFLTGIATCTNAQVGDTACITVMVLPTNGDANPANNSLTRCFAIGVSYDPNYKEVSPKGSGVEGFIPQNTNEFTYTLHFQNTGTAPAHNVYLLDTISNHLDLGTIEIVSSSHPMQPYLLPNRTMKFMFANIMLPDSTNDELHSHGYVTYRIKPNGTLPLGTQIKNTGYIYFDYNAPVVTNTTLNTIATPTGIKEASNGSSFKIYPNPAKDLLMVKLSGNESNTIVITDILGKEVLQQKTNGLTTELNVSSLQSGIYFVKVGEQTHKLMISK